MTAIYFIVSVVLTGLVASLIDVKAGTSSTDQPDYHLVPFAGDVWGA